MQEERCPLCLKIRAFDLENEVYNRFQNSERLVCMECSQEIEHRLRPTWQIVGGRIFPRNTMS